MQLKQKTMAFALSACGLSMALPASAIELDFGGFISVGGGIVSDETIDPTVDYDEDFSFDEDSILGLQTTAPINEKMGFTAQLVARGNEDYDLEAEWAFLQYDVSDEFVARAGRIRAPFFAYSESIEVGYSYHWIRPPGEVYRLPFSSLDGFDLDYTTWITDDWEVSSRVYGGTYNDDVELYGLTGDIDLNNGIGVVFSANYDWLTLRASAHHAEVSITNSTLETLDSSLRSAPALVGGPFDSIADDLLIDDTQVLFYEAAITVDYEGFLFIAEWTMLEFDDSAVPDDQGYMISVAKSFGEFTPHLTFAVQDTDPDSFSSDSIPCATTDLCNLQTSVAAFENDIETHSWIAGVRWDFMPSAAFKFEAQYIDNRDTKSLNSDETVYTIDTLDDGMLYSFVLDAVF